LLDPFLQIGGRSLRLATPLHTNVYKNEQGKEVIDFYHGDNGLGRLAGKIIDHGSFIQFSQCQHHARKK
jgi:hypothetical protein